MKAEEKTVAFMFFSVVLQFVYSLGKIFIGGKKQKQQKKKKKKKKNLRAGEWRGTKAEGQEGQILVADNRQLQ